MKNWHIWIPVIGIITFIKLNIKPMKPNTIVFWLFYQAIISMLILMTLVQINAGVIKL